MTTAAFIRSALRERCGELASAVFDKLAEDLIGTPGQARSSKDINDPIWKLFTLTPEQVSVVDLPLMQRLRRVRQLGLAHLVYPGAQHSRLEHSIGTMRAATVMFNKLSRNTDLDEKDRERIEQLISLAALMHDCGHTAFSHLGERVLASIFNSEFATAQEILRANLPDPVAFAEAETRTHKALPTKPPAAAEVLSALFVLSPAMSTFMGALGLPYTADEACLFVCGIIMGRPSTLMRRGRAYHHYIKSIVSGDIDCDKIDYVARDAYYAGLPISADVDRLLSQLATARLDRNTELPEIKVRFGDPDPDVYHLLAIRPAGASALEMFVMTRSYLFERIYTHHKVRAAERSLERLLREFLQYQKSVRGRSLEWCLAFILNRGGDDAVLDRLAEWEDENTEAQENFRTRAKRILDRKLPQRAFAISLRTLADYNRQAGRLPSATFIPWSLAFEDIAQNNLEIEDSIQAYLQGGKDRIYVDWIGSNPVKENPDIWVHDPSFVGTLLRVNHYFDVEQLSNAYRDVKLTGWVFCDDELKTDVAAATAYTLYEKYDLLPGPEALRRAKISKNSYHEALQALGRRIGSHADAHVANLLDASPQRVLRPPMNSFLPPLVSLDQNERALAATSLAGKFAASGLQRHYYDDFQFALIVLEFLVRHQVAFYRHPMFKDPVPRKNEERFQNHLMDFLRSQADFLQICEVSEHNVAAGGFTDVVVGSKDKNRRPVVVELKSAETDLAEQYENHAGQPLQYAEANYGRVALLYCQFASKASMRPADTLDLRSNVSASNQVTICLGQRAFADVPSAGGATTVAVSTQAGTAPA
ncbi:HD domain-containing protein [Lichenihabitans sp. Uapishka_5]|uniref:HD domain-containing protein n=1 Tax=Lichenihabitans sp. Uapishka_5 TaxID=3037302 RepID=UPI0029E7FA23|nr:HD domain-containing protein [Lichenihabitans sp. Uapishka_5]MDX7952923.1 HD domain-containing protein [Lichenihabitans sp. Uapishka_5]